MENITQLGVGGIFCVMVLKLVLDFVARNSIESHLIELKDLALKQLKEIYKMNGAKNV